MTDTPSTSLEITQVGLNHPGMLTDSDINDLRTLKPLQSVVSYGPTRPTERRDFGILLIVLGFVVTSVATGAFSEAGKDLYTFTKNHLVALMTNKAKATKAGQGTYEAALPEWTVTVTINPSPNGYFAATLKTTSPELMLEAAEQFATLTKHLQIDQAIGQRWYAEQRGSGLEVAKSAAPFPK
jgi:hypothetical protein